MKQNLAALELSAILKELKFLEGGKVDKIYNPVKKEFYFQIHVPSKGKFILRIVAGKLMYLTEFKPDFDQAKGFCVYLRKQLSGARLRKIEQKEFERVIELEFESLTGKKSLFIELFGRGNLVLTENNVIKSAVEQQKWADRSVMPGEVYVYPKQSLNFVTMTFERFREFCQSSEQDTIVKTLAMGLGLGGVYAEEACLRAHINKDSESGLGRKKLEVLFNVLADFRNLGGLGFIYENNDVVPIELQTYKDLKFEKFDTYNLALNNYFTELLKTEIKTRIVKTSNSKLDKVKKIIEVQIKAADKLEKDEISNRLKGELLYNNYQLIGQVLLQFREALKKYSVTEIKERLKGQKIISSYDEKEQTIVVNLE